MNRLTFTSDGRVAPDTTGMRYPVRCRFCSNVHDSGKVTVVGRYADCDTWRCPGCDVLINNRPEGWGGSAFPLPGHPNYRGVAR